MQPVSISCCRAQAQHYLDVYELRSLATLIGPCAPARKPAKPNPPPHTRPRYSAALTPPLRLRGIGIVPSTSASGPHPVHICARTGPTPGHICTETGLARATSAPGLGSPLPTSAPGLGSPLPHLRFLPPSLGEWRTPSTARLSSLWLMGACMHGAAWVPHTDRGCACDGDAQGRARLHVGPHAWCACAPFLRARVTACAPLLRAQVWRARV